MLSAGGEPLTDFGQLRQQVEKAKDSTLTVDILRKGTKQVLQLTSGKRPWNPDIFMPGTVEIPDDVEVTTRGMSGTRTGMKLHTSSDGGDLTWNGDLSSRLR